MDAPIRSLAPQAHVVQHPYGFTVTTLTGHLALEPRPFQRPDSHIVSPSWQAVAACATPDVMSADGNYFDLQRSTATGCYPLSLPTSISLKRSMCDEVADPQRTRTVAFVEWIYSANIGGALQQMNIAPLYTVSAQAAAANRAALDFITCDPLVRNAFPVGLVIG